MQQDINCFVILLPYLWSLMYSHSSNGEVGTWKGISPRLTTSEQEAGNYQMATKQPASTKGVVFRCACLIQMFRKALSATEKPKSTGSSLKESISD